MLDSTRPPTHRNATAGTTMKMPRNRTIASTIESAICFEESCSSSGADSRAEMDSARNPMARACPSAITPRRIGLVRTGCRRATESIRCDSTCRLRSGRRTATAQTSRPRIMTPSTTA
jgi:hypothetical protein